MIKNVDELKAANSVFFSKATMEFFNSELAIPIFPADGGAYFVTSERMDESDPRRYTVRFMSDEGEDTDVSEFQAYDADDWAVAMNFAADLARESGGSGPFPKGQHFALLDADDMAVATSYWTPKR